MSDLEPLARDLRALFDEERAGYPHDPDAQARVQRRLEAAILLGGAAGAAAGAASAGAGAVSSLSLEAAKHAKVWIALSLVAGIVVGETHARLSAPPVTTTSTSAPPVGSFASVSSPPAAPASGAPTPAGSDPAAVAVSSLPSPRPAPVPSASSAAPAILPAPGEAPSDLAAEQGLIDTARSALSRGRGADALHAADDHARRFPRGRLAEEREMLAIQALLLVGKRADAEARVSRFHEAYPQSLYGSAVDALLRPREDAGP